MRPTDLPARVIGADELLAGRQELVIEHQHRHYRLCRTNGDLLVLSPQHSRLLRLTSTRPAALVLLPVGAALILSGWLIGDPVTRVCLSLNDQVGTRGLVELWREDAGTTTLLPDGVIWKGRIRDVVGQTAAGCLTVVTGSIVLARSAWVLCRRLVHRGAQSQPRDR